MCESICFNWPISDWLLSLTEVAGISTSATSWALQGKFCRWVNRIPPTNTLSYTKLNWIHQINQVFPIELSLIRLIKDRTQKLVRAVSEFCIYVRLRVKGLFYLIWKYRYLWYKKNIIPTLSTLQQLLTDDVYLTGFPLITWSFTFLGSDPPLKKKGVSSKIKDRFFKKYYGYSYEKSVSIHQR